jgi:hypothetical protein
VKAAGGSAHLNLAHHRNLSPPPRLTAVLFCVPYSFSSIIDCPGDFS